MALASLPVPTWRTMDEASEQTGIGRRTLTRWVSEGRLRAYSRAGDRKRYIDLDDIKKLQQLQVLPTRDEVKARLGRLVDDMESGRIADWGAARAEANECARLLRGPGIRAYDKGGLSLIRRAQRVLRSHPSR